MNPRSFDWTNLFGSLTAAEAAEQARDAVQTFEDYAEDILSFWESAGEPVPDEDRADYVKRIVAEMEEEA